MTKLANLSKHFSNELVSLGLVLFGKKGINSKKLSSLKLVLEYNGHLEPVKVAHQFTLGKRTIYAPSDEYKKFLKKFKHVLSATLPGAARGGSLISYQASYTGTKFICKPVVYCVKNTKKELYSALASLIGHTNAVAIKYDIAKAFDSVTIGMVYDVLLKKFSNKNIQYNLLEAKEKLTELLSKFEYLFIDGKLPQGFNTSSILFELVMQWNTEGLNTYITKAIKSYHGKYCKYCYARYDLEKDLFSHRIARYVDDCLLVINFNNTDKPCRNHYNFLLDILNRYYGHIGFKLNKSKIRIHHTNRRTPIKFYGVEIANPASSKCVNITRKARNKLRGMEHKAKNLDHYLKTDSEKKKFMVAFNSMKAYYKYSMS